MTLDDLHCDDLHATPGLEIQRYLVVSLSAGGYSIVEESKHGVTRDDAMQIMNFYRKFRDPIEICVVPTTGLFLGTYMTKQH